MRVVEIGRLQFSSQLEVEIGSKDCVFTVA